MIKTRVYKGAHFSMNGGAEPRGVRGVPPLVDPAARPPRRRLLVSRGPLGPLSFNPDYEGFYGSGRLVSRGPHSPLSFNDMLNPQSPLYVRQIDDPPAEEPFLVDP